MKVLLLEPFNGGSHAHFVQMLQKMESNEIQIHSETLTAKKFKWRMRGSAWFFSQKIPREHFDVVLCTSACNLCELIGLRPDLAAAKKILYFHENQLGYPVQVKLERDIQLGLSQVLSCQVADLILWNSSFNRDQFVEKGLSDLNKIIPPDQRVDKITLQNSIVQKSHVVPVPLDNSWFISAEEIYRKQQSREGPLHILWNHRLEYDKQPELFFECLVNLKSQGLPFIVTILGDNFRDDLPKEIIEYKNEINEHIIHWGFLPSAAEYKRVLQGGKIDMVVSTAVHEYQGLSILESTVCGIFPLCPNRLAYPDYLPKECLYNTNKQLMKKLRYFAKNVKSLRDQEISTIEERIFGDVFTGNRIFSPSQYLWSHLQPIYEQHIRTPK